MKDRHSTVAAGAQTIANDRVSRFEAELRDSVARALAARLDAAKAPRVQAST